MKKLLLTLLLLATPALGQSVTQSGSVTPGHAARWVSSGVVGDAGTAASGLLTSLGVTNNGGPGVCVNSAANTGAYNQICLAATTNGGTKISSYAYGGATSPGITFDINGSVQGFPAVTLPVTNNAAACFDGTTGLLKSCGFTPITAALTNAHILVGNASNIATDVALSGDCSLVAAGTITCTKTNGVSFAASATTDTTNATNITSGTLNVARLPASLLFLPLPNGTAANPALYGADTDSGFNFGSGEVNTSANSTQVFTVTESAGTAAFGSPLNYNTLAPSFKVDNTGGGLIRTYKLIAWQPSDTPEVSFYSSTGTSASPSPWLANNLGNQMALNYLAIGSWDDDSTSNFLLSDTYRLITPFRLSGSTPFSISKWMPSVSAYASGQTWQFKWVAASPASPQINLNPGSGALGNRSIRRADCVTNPGAAFWNAGAEITVVDNGSVLCATADSDNAAGRTDRAAFANPSWGRSFAFAMRNAQVPEETGKGASWVVQITKPNDTVLRERMWVSTLGSTVIGGLGSFEDGPTLNGITAEDYSPGPLLNSPSDCYYYGQYFAGLCGPQNSFNTVGAGALTVVASDDSKWSAIATRKSGDVSKGYDISYHHGGDRVLFESAWPSATPLTVSTVVEKPTVTGISGGLCQVTTTTAHGLQTRDVVVIASVTGATAVNGTWTVLPVTTTTFIALGTNCNGQTYTGGPGSVTKTQRLVRGTLKPDTGVWNFGGDAGGSSLQINPTTNQVNWLTATGSITTNPPILGVDGSDTNVGLALVTKGTGQMRFLTQGQDVLRLLGATASKVNYVTVDGAATGNTPTISVDGSDTNIGAIVATKGTGNLRMLTNGGEILRLSGGTASKVNYIIADGAAAAGTPALNVAGTDSDIDFFISAKGTGGVNIKGTGTNDNASAGNVGEVMTSSVSSGSAVALTTATPANVLPSPLALTAGDWDCYQQVYFNPNATTNIALWFSSISETSATLDTTAGRYILQREGRVIGGDFGGYTVGPVRKSLTATTNIYMVARSDFTVSTNAAFGTLTCRRIR